MTNLTDRMRTCAAYLQAMKGALDELLRNTEGTPMALVVDDAAALLLEASELLEAIAIEPIEKLTEQPMELIQAPPPPTYPPKGLTYDEATRRDLDRNAIDAPTIPPLPYDQGLIEALARVSGGRACPRCDSRAQKKVRREGRLVLLTCPVCGQTWEWLP